MWIKGAGRSWGQGAESRKVAGCELRGAGRKNLEISNLQQVILASL
ncbi:MAG: hypothetical protein WCE64_09450 [Bacteroidales bacterium]